MLYPYFFSDLEPDDKSLILIFVVRGFELEPKGILYNSPSRPIRINPSLDLARLKDPYTCKIQNSSSISSFNLVLGMSSFRTMHYRMKSVSAYALMADRV